MKIAVIKSSVLLLLTGCKYNQINNENKVTQPVFERNVIFDDYKQIQVWLDWEGHKLDSVLFFNVWFKNITNKKITFKTNLVATNIPFLLIYNKNRNKINFNIVHQFNTIFLDSMLLKVDKKNDIYIDEYYFVQYPKNQKEEVYEIKLVQKLDTIFIER
ncbi:hypothetical protein CKY20_10835 [Capnocytophaga canis]|uniref:Uncharacterized protein n=1 Tax=Capnocytophaga canis TaxID=1848903 RepID=A0A3A1YDS7_9FLAO|nr:hypothetical protein [Capnocytophaga canis]RIY35350.1 hypothetical protein CKY20_10835 [Capnocytophaga canis]